MCRIRLTESLRQKLQDRMWIERFFPDFRFSDDTRRKDVCIIDALRLLSVKAPYDRDGPLWARVDANDLLTPFGMTLTPQARFTSMDTGKSPSHAAMPLPVAYMKAAMHGSLKEECESV